MRFILTIVQFRAASELSVAGSEAGNRFSDDEAGRSSIGDGHFSCSSVFSEFGYVAQHLEELNPSIAHARCFLFPHARHASMHALASWGTEQYTGS